MKVVHVLKRMEEIDEDIKELRKLEKQLNNKKSFTSPIYMSIEKQINILLGERIKLIELRIENPPENLVEEIEGTEEERNVEVANPRDKPKPRAKAKASKKAAAKKTRPRVSMDDMDDDDIPMLTQDAIDAKISSMQEDPTEKKEEYDEPKAGSPVEYKNDENIKILDIALERGTLKKEDTDKEKEKKVRFFRENFPSE